MAVVSLYRSTIGKKVIMAVTGFIWVGYVMLHMFGNLKYFVGATSINGWAEFLRTFGQDIIGYSGFLWLVRIVLITSVLLHILMAYQLTQLDWASRPVRYSGRQYLAASFSGRTMRWGGVFIVLFLVYHIFHMTVGNIHPNYEELKPYHNLVVAFRDPIQVVFYVVAMIVLGLHLYHGVWSMFQTLGVNSFPRNATLHRVAQAIAVLVPLGFISLPIAILLGIGVRP